MENAEGIVRVKLDAMKYGFRVASTSQLKQGWTYLIRRRSPPLTAEELAAWIDSRRILDLFPIVTRIQAAFRGRNVRRQYSEHTKVIQRIAAATKIQAVYRGRMVRKLLQIVVTNSEPERPASPTSPSSPTSPTVGGRKTAASNRWQKIRKSDHFSKRQDRVMGIMTLLRAGKVQEANRMVEESKRYLLLDHVDEECLKPTRGVEVDWGGKNSDYLQQRIRLSRVIGYKAAFGVSDVNAAYGKDTKRDHGAVDHGADKLIKRQKEKQKSKQEEYKMHEERQELIRQRALRRAEANRRRARYSALSTPKAQPEPSPPVEPLAIANFTEAAFTSGEAGRWGAPITPRRAPSVDTLLFSAASPSPRSRRRKLRPQSEAESASASRGEAAS